MPTTMLNDVDLGANARTTNRLSGDINEFISVDSIVTLSAVATASAVNLSIFADSDIAVDDKEIINIGTTLNASDHVIDTFAVRGGTRMALFLRTTSAVATTDVLIKMEVQPLQ